MDRGKLAHELDTISLLVARIKESVRKHDSASFANDRDVIDATAYRLATIGEHCKRLPADLQERHPDIPWRQMIGLRNVVSHAYDEVDTAIVWSAATLRLDAIAQMCSAETARLA